MNTFNLTLDLDKEQWLPQVVTLRQGDKSGTQLVATIYDHGQLVGGGYTARVSLRHPGSGDTYYRETATYSNGVATVTVDEQYAATVAGVTTGYFELLQGSTVKASTADFIVRILPSAEDGAVPGSVYDSAIEDALAELDAATGRISQMVVDATAEYLAAHPEITTTVQDNSVTDAKLIQSGGVLDRVGRLWWRLENLLTNTPAEAESVTVADAAKTPVAGLTVFGKSTQDGTPTPDAPVAIESVESANLVDYLTNYYAGTVTLVDGKLVNKVTDSKTFTTPVIQTKLNGTTQETFYFSNQNITDAGTYGRSFATTKAFDTILIKHNGSSEDVIFLQQGLSGKAGSGYYATITLDGTNPSVEGGLVACDIALYDGLQSRAYTPYGSAGLWARGRNLLLCTSYSRLQLDNGITWTVNADGSVHAKGTSTGTSQVYWFVPKVDAARMGGMVLSGAPNVSGCSVRLEMRGAPYTVYAADTTGAGATISLPSGGVADASLMCRVDSGKTVDVTFHPMIRPAGTSADYEPYAESVTAIPLDGHVLRSLPDGTRDEVTVDQYGHVTLVQRVGSMVLDGSSDEGWSYSSSSTYSDPTNGKYCYYTGSIFDANIMKGVTLFTSSMASHYRFVTLSALQSNKEQGTCTFSAQDTHPAFTTITPYTTLADFTSWLASNPVTVQYALANPVTHDLGTIDPTALVGPDMTAQAVPTAPFALTYERDLNATLARLEAAIAELATN